jgi:hypothetical protein
MFKILFSIALTCAAVAETIDVPPAGASVVMDNFGGRPLVEVRINGKGPYRFIVDTGAAFTGIDESLKAELALPSVGAFGQVRIAEFRVGEAVLHDISVQLTPFATFFRVADPPRGVMGASAFPGYLMVFDYPKKRLSVRKGELPAADGRRSFQYTDREALPTVPLRAAGKEIRVHVDTGSPMAVTLPEKYLKELPLAAPATEKGKVRTPGGEFSIWAAEVKGAIELGEYKLDFSTVQFSDVKPGPGPPSGNIGAEVLKGFVVTLDSKNRRIRFDPPA